MTGRPPSNPPPPPGQPPDQPPEPSAADRPSGGTCPPRPSPSPVAKPNPDAILCPICGVPGVEKLEKWFCPRCKMLLRTCCD